MASLTELTGSERRTFVAADGCTIGRDPQSGILLPDPLVSRRHAELRLGTDGRWRIVDLGSSHGTYVAGRRVMEAALVDGDEIHVGGSRLRFVERALMPSYDVDEWSVFAEPQPPSSAGACVTLDGQFPPERLVLDADSLRRDYEKLRAAYELSRALGAQHDLHGLLDRLLDTAFQLLAADRGAVFLLDPETQRPTLRVARRRSGTRVRMTLSRTIVGEVLATRTGVLSADAGIDDRFSRAGSILGEGVRSTMCVPLVHRGELLGIMLLDSLVAANVFGPKDLELFTSIANEAALTVKNVTLRRRLEAVLADERRRLERVVRDLPVGVLLLDRERRILLTNRHADELLPLVTSARQGDVLDALGHQPIADLVGARDAAGAAASVDLVIPGPPRRVVAVSAERSVASDSAGEVVVALHDVSRERESEERTARAERIALVGRLAGGIAHDFNNLLCVINAYADILATSLEGSPLLEEVQPIREAGQRAAALTHQLLAFSRKQLVKAEVVDMNAIVDGMAMMIRRTVGENIELATSLASSLWAVKADPGKLEQVLLNLVVNARDAMPDGGKLAVETANFVVDARGRHDDDLAPGRYVMLTVSDTGCGMSPEVKARIFEPFFTTKDVGKGTGLGLATVYGIVKQAGGSIWVESTIDAGSTFRVCLPMTAEQRSERPRRTANLPLIEEAHGVILVAEDEDAVRSLTKRILRAAGYQVIEARHGGEALELIDAPGEIDLLLTDVVMPEMSGEELATRLRERRPSLPVVFMTGYTEHNLGRSGTFGATPPQVLQKPFDRAQLLAYVQEALRAHAALDG